VPLPTQKKRGRGGGRIVEGVTGKGAVSRYKVNK